MLLKFRLIDFIAKFAGCPTISVVTGVVCNLVICMKKFVLLLAMLWAFAAFAYQPKSEEKSPSDIYLEKYAGYAVEEMHRSGVPASITLAQGMLESNYGRSELAVNANNHFGIQCHSSWTGDKYRHMDSGQMRDFRKYETVLGSYHDHSQFLSGNKRYKSLFELDKSDYKGWANGLQKAGYAEDPSYAAKLISVIERYGLDKYDMISQVPSVEKAKPAKKEKKDKPGKKEKHVAAAQSQVVVVVDEKPVTERQRKSHRYNLAREMYSQNGVPFVYSCSGETYSDIAKQYNLFLKEILRYNDVEFDGELPYGTVVYLQAKKAKAAKGYDEYIVEEGMGMWEISQKYGVKVSKLRKLNGVADDYMPNVGDVIVLR